MKTAAVFFADGFEDIEALSPVDYLRRAGIELTTVGVKGTPFNSTLIVTSSHKVPIITDTTLEDFLSKKIMPDCVICPGGGKGAENLSENSKLLSFLENAYDSGKLIGAICASPAVVLGKTKILENKKWTCYPDMQGNAKSEYLDGYKDEVFVTDKNVVTSRGAGASEQFAMEIIRLLCGEETAEKIRKGTCQR
ncbi:MAG: DJ-1/PfpI family protein [Spirochaetales bacterium]|nr:DJ-1/PfpI family protein [Spirochaetales bacterium]